MIAASDTSGMVWLWDVATLQPVATLKGFLLGAHSVAFSPDGRRLAAGSNGQEAVKLWDVETRQEVLTLSGEGSLFSGLSFSSDGRYLMKLIGNLERAAALAAAKALYANFLGLTSALIGERLVLLVLQRAFPNLDVTAKQESE